MMWTLLVSTYVAADVVSRALLLRDPDYNDYAQDFYILPNAANNGCAVTENDAFVAPRDFRTRGLLVLVLYIRTMQRTSSLPPSLIAPLWLRSYRRRPLLQLFILELLYLRRCLQRTSAVLNQSGFACQ